MNLEMSINSTKGANNQYDLFHEKLLNSIDKHVPLKPVNQYQRKHINKN